MSNRSLIDDIEQVLVTEVGTGGAILMDQYLHELGLTRKTFRQKHAPSLVNKILQEYDKVLGTHVNFLRIEINKTIEH